MAGSDLAKRASSAPAPGVDPLEEPSAEWGWHGGFPRATRIAGWIVALGMFAMLYGNHRGLTADLWLILIGLGIIGFLVYDQVRRRTSWRK